MAETAIAAVLSKFGELAASEAKVLLEVGDDMMLLRDRLEWLQAFLRDADHKRRTGTDRLTRVWVRQTRDVAFQAEDALDEFFHKVDLETQGYQGWKKWLNYLIGFWTQIVVRRELSGRLQKINRRLDQISDNQKEYKIEHIPLATSISSTTATSAWRDGYKSAVGFEKNVDTLKKMLLHEGHPEQMFISILGESGVGKTTLSRIILHNMKKHNYFEILVWYNMQPDSTTEDLLQQIYKRAQQSTQTLQHLPEEGSSHVSEMLRHLLAKKKYMLIIVGISSKTMLNCVRASLPDDNNYSRVVLVLDTENEEVGWHANAMNKKGIKGIHPLSRLDEEISGQLFCSRAFRKYQSDGRENMSKYNKIVYSITGGYPLAIVVLAGLLRFKENPGQWEAVLQQLRPGPALTEQVQDGEDNQIIGPAMLQEDRVEEKVSPPTQANLLSTRRTIERVFWASFEDLPNDLKSCFLYLAAFPKDTYLSADSMVLMWMAEGFIKPQKGKTVEELGHSYVKELALRCLIQVTAMNAAGGIDKIIVHRSLHGFLHSEAREAGFIEVHDMHDVFVPPSVRRLSFMSFQGGYTTFTNRFRKLRSFICWAKEKDPTSNDSVKKEPWHDLKFLRGSSLLRVIYIWGLKIKELPYEIGGKIHLRYLRVNSKDLEELPPSIKGLLNLQTLDIRDTQVEEIHPSFWQIKTLRHVIAGNLTLPASSIDQELDELQTLHGVKLPIQGRWDEQNCLLLKMTKLRSLEMHGVHAKHGEALKAALGRMHLLHHLKLEGDDIPSCIFTGQGRLQYLQTVKLDGTLQWPAVDDLRVVRPNLIQLSLTNTNDAPKDKQEELRKVGFNRSLSQPVGFNGSPSLPVYELSYKQVRVSAPKPEHQGEASCSKMEQQHQTEEVEE